MSLELVKYYKALREKNLDLVKDYPAYLYDYKMSNTLSSNIITLQSFIKNNEAGASSLKSFKSVQFLYNFSKPELLKFISAGNRNIISNNILVNYLSTVFDTDVYYYRNLFLNNDNYLPKYSDVNPSIINTVIGNITKELTFGNDGKDITTLTVKRNNTGLGFSTTVTPSIRKYEEKEVINWELPYEYTDSSNNNINYDTDYKIHYSSISGNNIEYDIGYNTPKTSPNSTIYFPSLYDNSKIDTNKHSQKNSDILTAFKIKKVNSSNSTISTNGELIKLDYNSNINENNDLQKLENENNNLQKLFYFSRSINGDVHSIENNTYETNRNYDYNSVKLKVDTSENKNEREYILETDVEFNEYDTTHSVFTFGISGHSFFFSEYGKNHGIYFKAPHTENVPEDTEPVTEITFDERMYIIMDKLQEVETTTTTTEVSTTE